MVKNALNVEIVCLYAQSTLSNFEPHLFKEAENTCTIILNISKFKIKLINFKRVLF
jgi:hypothetical protein